MERSIISEIRMDQKKQFYYRKYLYVTLLGGGIGFVLHPIVYAFALFYIAYFYMRDKEEYKFAIIGILMGSLRYGIIPTYLYGLGFTLFYLITHILRLLDKNIYRLLPWLCACLSIPYSLYAYGLKVNTIIIAIGIFALMVIDCEEYNWIRKDLVFTESMYGVLILTSAYALISLVESNYHSFIISIAFVCLAFVCTSRVVLILLFLHLALRSGIEIIPIYLITSFVIANGKQYRLLSIIAILMSSYLLHTDIFNIAILSLFLVFLLFFKEEEIPFSIYKNKKQKEIEITQNLLNRQIHNFSNVFQLLSQYYTNISDMESQMLSNMALALKSSADSLKQVDTRQTLYERIQKALEGYHYDVQNIELHDSFDGQLSLELDIRNIKKIEIRSTLVPLMEVITRQKLKVSQILHHRFSSGYHHISLEMDVPYSIDAHADSQRNYYESSGDTYSIFQFRNMVLCIISDGMGNGKKAAKSSRIITQIFQRMIMSGIAKDECIRCVNQLIQSDTYATLDVLCFDCSEGKAYIFKSAACPTYLIRDQHIYEVCGNSLPVGIMSSIEPDCYVVDLKEKDEFLMISDGIELNEIYHWMKTHKQTSAQEAMKECMKIIRNQQREDDSTAIIACVNKRS